MILPVEIISDIIEYLPDNEIIYIYKNIPEIKYKKNVNLKNYYEYFNGCILNISRLLEKQYIINISFNDIRIFNDFIINNLIYVNQLYNIKIYHSLIIDIKILYELNKNIEKTPLLNKIEIYLNYSKQWMKIIKNDLFKKNNKIIKLYNYNELNTIT